MLQRSNVEVQVVVVVVVVVSVYQLLLLLLDSSIQQTYTNEATLLLAQNNLAMETSYLIKHDYQLQLHGTINCNVCICIQLRCYLLAFVN